ncbi:nuclear transport factor 2 family protein [Parahaliea sp. F7430]|uniref:Nuclear transport factor 2 family protein n=1 Tax=Sediminihaliea albiluteola TaxID=2758564 RepID=A0A7W2TXE0_9GAMM|nr:nuclear transport factor 2 family protein [Sediminihaliea albiluteola]MBA6413725.1 nuclear transport factor 2 family protein [Sediminihaliea albiluteola]
MSEQVIRSALADEAAIRQVLARYCRGLDRMDKAMAYAVWHEGGTANYYDIFQGSGRGFVDWVWEAHAEMERHSHQIAQSVIDLDGDTACSETYVTVALWTNPDEQGEQQEIIGRGRYLDMWSRREGRWAIDHREHVLDMQTVQPLRRGYVSDVSQRDSTDPSYKVLG